MVDTSFQPDKELGLGANTQLPDPLNNEDHASVRQAAFLVSLWVWWPICLILEVLREHLRIGWTSKKTTPLLRYFYDNEWDLWVNEVSHDRDRHCYIRRMVLQENDFLVICSTL